MKLLTIFICTLFCTVVIPTRADNTYTIELNNPSWQEVPNSNPFPTSEDSDPAYIDINSLIKDGNLVTFDMVDAHVSYVQMQVNCKTNQYRVLKMGAFESARKVTYVNIVESGYSSWDNVELSGNSAIVIFVCNYILSR